MIQQTRKTILYIAFGVGLYAALMNLDAVLVFFNKTVNIVLPILLGMIFAFILSVPMRGFERLLACVSAKWKRPLQGKLLYAVSLGLTLLCIGFVIVLAVTFVIPEFVSSAKSIVPLVKEKLPVWESALAGCNIDTSRLLEQLSSLDWQNMYGDANRLLNSAVGAAASTMSGIVNTVFGIVIAVYLLLSKNVLSLQAKKIMSAYLKKPAADRVLYVTRLVWDTYAKFLSGQCVEAVLLGSLIFIAYSLFGLPYAGLIAFLTGIFSFVPYVGAFAACFIGAFLTLLAAPSQVILCIGVYMVVQFIENQFIYPHVVGTSVGLSALWTLLSALLGGKLFGLPGIIFFIPLMAVLYTLVRDDVNKKIQEKET